MTIFDSAEWLRQLKNYSGSGDLLDEANSHDARFGSTSGADTNDPLFEPNAGEQHLFLPGTSGNDCDVPSTTQLNLSGTDFTFEIDVLMNDWTISATFICKDDVSGNGRSWDFHLMATGTLILEFFNDAGDFIDSAISELTTGLSDGDRAVIKAEVDHDGGSTQFYVNGATLGNAVSHTVLTGANLLNADGTMDVKVGSRNGNTNNIDGHIYRATIYDDLTQTNTILDVVPADATEPYATFTERSSNAATVTINRSATGLVSTIIDRAWALLTTDDFFETPDDPLLDFAAGDAGTWMVMFRTNTVAAGSDVLLAKKDNLTTAAGYALVRNAANGQGIIADGTLDDDDTVATIAVHTLHTLAMVRNTTDDDIEVFLDGVGSGSETTDSTTASLANALVQRLGATSGATAANFFEGVIGADAGWRSALTDAEVLEAHLLLTALPAFDETGLSIIVNATLASTDSQAMADSVGFTVTATLATADVAAFTDSVGFTITATLATGTESAAYFETGAGFTINATFVSTDSAAFVDSVGFTVTATLATADVAAFTDSVGFTINASLASTDAATFTDSVGFTINATLTGTDGLTFVDSVGFTITATLGATDAAAFVDSVGFTINATLATADIAAFVDSVGFTINATLAATESAAYFETSAGFTINATLTGTDVFTPGVGAAVIRWAEGSLTAATSDGSMSSGDETGNLEKDSEEGSLV